MKWYAGIGSRETPPEILTMMKSIGMNLAYHGWTLRSGCAPGADTAFEDGAFDAYFITSRTPKPELYLPWPRFEGRRKTVVKREEPQPEAYPIAEFFHPAWERCTRGARALHARNVHQVIGYDVEYPALSSFVVCWTPGGKRGGGTGQALRIAEHYNIEILDLAREQDMERVLASEEFGFC